MRWLIFMPLLALLAGLAGCTSSVEVRGSLPSPLVAKIPARVGIHYPDEFRNYRHEEDIEGAGSWGVEIGTQNHAFFSNLFAALFREARELSEASLATEEAAGLDGLLIPYIEKYGFLIPSLSGLNFISASIDYRLALYDRAGEKVAEWRFVGYGKQQGGNFRAEDALNDATRLAIRDGGARIAIDFAQQPAVQKWLAQMAADIFARDEAVGDAQFDDSPADDGN